MSQQHLAESLWSPRKSFLFLTALVFVFVQAGFFARRISTENNDPTHRSMTLQLPRSLPTASVFDHPIPHLMDDAERRFRNLLSRQSRSLRAAVAEYRRRYGRNPPKGFDAWWRFAQANKVKMIDEYDGLVSDLEPFWELTGAAFRMRTLQAAQHLPSIDLVRIRGGEAEAFNVKSRTDKDDVSMRARSFLKMIEKFRKMLPDLDFAINARSEGRVLVPWEDRKYPNITRQESFPSTVGPLSIPDWRGEGSVWESYRRICPPDAPARRIMSSKRAATFNGTTNYVHPSESFPGPDFVFATDTARKFSFCDNPSSHVLQGHFFSDWRTVPIPFPILSPAKGLGFGDIKIPSHYYYGTTKRYSYAWDDVNMELKRLDSMETPWEKKDDRIFFRGATTGGGSSPRGFSPYYQRHRFVKLASSTSETTRTVVFADPPSSTNFVYASVPMASLNREIMDVAFVSSVDHDHYPGGLAQQILEHRFDDAVVLSDYWAHKYILDLDGMSYSGKFFAFLGSDSAVIKSSVYHEFFSDWIQPWLHYIPLSTSHAEIYNIHAFFSGGTMEALAVVNSTVQHLPPRQRVPLDGDKRLRRIARAGKNWKDTIGRRVDMEAYVFRLCLEYARLAADNRESMDFIL
ncbi:capsular associated protein [Russula earlei]|uniref:Capsular associated protein n=1 Tax=Russula earlei TaxID=71964 RepID=A0ACC0U2F1_9AGAM|nr:capsular associated protein [Russula earlei]